MDFSGVPEPAHVGYIRGKQGISGIGPQVVAWICTGAMRGFCGEKLKLGAPVQLLRQKLMQQRLSRHTPVR